MSRDNKKKLVHIRKHIAGHNSPFKILQKKKKKKNHPLKAAHVLSLSTRPKEPVLSLSLSLYREMATKTASSMASKAASILLLLLLHSATHASPIKTVVVLVMENRSFDHMLGWMKQINPEINGVDGTEWNALSVTDPNSKRFFFNNQSHYVDPDPGHSFQAIREQIFGSDNTAANPAPMNGFAQQAYSMDNTTNMSQSVMNGFQPDKVAVYKALVSEFAVFDR